MIGPEDYAAWVVQVAETPRPRDEDVVEFVRRQIEPDHVSGYLRNKGPSGHVKVSVRTDDHPEGVEQAGIGIAGGIEVLQELRRRCRRVEDFDPAGFVRNEKLGPIQENGEW